MLFVIKAWYFSADYLNTMHLKTIAACLIFFCAWSQARAQLVFRNTGPDTMRVAVATFYDSSRKAIMKEGWFAKPVIVTGWYRLFPGDSAVIGKLFGPAVYYRREILKKAFQYPISDSIAAEDSYREWLMISNSDITDSLTFRIKHPIDLQHRRPGLVSAEFRLVRITAEAKEAKRLLIELGRRSKG